MDEARKTLADWNTQQASPTLEQYLAIGDLVDVALIAACQDVVKPETLNANMFQLGEPYTFTTDAHDQQLKPTFATFVDVAAQTGYPVPTWMYCGSCFPQSTAPNTTIITDKIIKLSQINDHSKSFTPEENFKVTDRKKGEVLYIGAGGDVVVPPFVDCCVVRCLECQGCEVTALDTSSAPELQRLYCFINPLTALDTTHNPALTRLDCQCCDLATLDVSHNPELWYLDCSLNKLTDIDLSHNPILQGLHCENNKLTTLDISHNPILLSYGELSVGAGVQVQKTPQHVAEKPSAVSARENANTPAADRRTSAKSIAASTQARPAISSPHKSKGALR